MYLSRLHLECCCCRCCCCGSVAIPLLLLLLLLLLLCVAILPLLLLLLAAAVRHRVREGKICCWCIESDASVSFLLIQTNLVFIVPLGSTVAFTASICSHPRYLRACAEPRRASVCRGKSPSCIMRYVPCYALYRLVPSGLHRNAGFYQFALRIVALTQRLGMIRPKLVPPMLHLPVMLSRLSSNSGKMALVIPPAGRVEVDG